MSVREKIQIKHKLRELEHKGATDNSRLYSTLEKKLSHEMFEHPTDENTNHISQIKSQFTTHKISKIDKRAVESARLTP